MAMMSLNKYKRCTFQVKTRHRCLYMNVSEGSRLSSEMCRWHFYFILPMIPDKAAFMSADVTVAKRETAMLNRS